MWSGHFCRLTLKLISILTPPAFDAQRLEPTGVGTTPKDLLLAIFPIFPI